jgi:hypothetical protein
MNDSENQSPTLPLSGDRDLKLSELMTKPRAELSREQMAVTHAVSDFAHWVRTHEEVLKWSRKHGFVVGVDDETRDYLSSVLEAVFAKDTGAANLASASYQWPIKG